MPWWLWVLLGFVLLALEMTNLGLHLAFFGIGALVVALLVALGVGGPLWVQLLLFTGISAGSLLFLRKRLVKIFKLQTAGVEVDALVGETAIATEEIEANGIGRAEMRGTSWSARNVGEAPVSKGQRCRVEKIDGLLLLIRA